MLQTKGRLRGFRTRSQFSVLEARVLYSADLGVAASLPTENLSQGPAVDSGPTNVAAYAAADTRQSADRGIRAEANAKAGLAERSTFDDLSELMANQISGAAKDSPGLEVILIDNRVPDLEVLRASFQTDTRDGRNLAVLVIDSQSDGLQLATQMLAAAGQPVTAIHIISHGEPGITSLGAAQITLQSIESRSAELAQWARYLSDDADILLYGCDLAGNALGVTMLSRLGEITGADIAASTNTTGAKALGGDWDLEYHAGQIDHRVIATTDLQAQWNAILAPATSAEITVNPSLPGDQRVGPESSGQNVSVNQAGDVAVTWVDIDAGKVYARLFLPDGTARSAPITVYDPAAEGLSNTLSLYRASPVIAVREDGSFVVAWSENHTLGGDRINAQRFTPEGLPLGPRIDVSNGASHFLYATPDISLDASGGFVIAYQTSDNLLVLFGLSSDYDVHVSGFNADASVRFADQQVGTPTNVYEGEISVAAKPDGSFIVAWTASNYVPATPSAEVLAQRFNAAGVPLSGEFLVNSTVPGDQFQPSVATSNDGNFVISYSSDVRFSGSLVGRDIRLQSYFANGTPNNSEQLVSPNGPWNESSSIAVDPTDASKYVVVWSNSVNGDGSLPRIQSRGYSGYGFSGGTVYLTSDPGSQNFHPGLASNGNLTVVDYSRIGSAAPYNTFDARIITYQNDTSAYLNLAPTNMVPGPRSLLEGSGPLAFTLSSGQAIQIGDSDATGELRVDVSIPVGNGALSILNASMVKDALTLTNYGGAISGNALHLRGTVSQLNQALAQLNFAPAANCSGLVAITINTTELYGGSPLTTTDTVNINITPVNDAPTGTSLTYTLNEDQSHALTVADFGFADAADTPANAMTSVIITALPASGTFRLSGSPVVLNQPISVTDLNAGRLVYTPVANASGPNYASFSFKVQDDGGTANGGIDTDTTARTLTFDITPVSDAPSGANQTRTILEDSSYVLNPFDFGFVDATDSPANTLSAVKITTLPDTGTLSLAGSPVTLNQHISRTDLLAGNLVFAPDTDATGLDTSEFFFKVIDNGATTNGGQVMDPVSRSFTFNVTAVNDAPQAVNQARTILEDQPYTFSSTDFGFNDVRDVPANNFTGLIISSLPGNGSLTLAGSPVSTNQFITTTQLSAGSLVFTPGANANGPFYASFNFTVKDDGGTANGGADTAGFPQSFGFNITAVSDAPSGANQTRSLFEDDSYSFSPSDFGFSDAQDSPSDTLHGVKITALPVAGTLTLGGVAVSANQTIARSDLLVGNLVFTPVANASGINYASFSFKVVDNGSLANGGQNISTSARSFNFDVLSLNDAPSGSNQSVSITEDGSHTFSSTDFGFADAQDSPTNQFAGVRITALPSSGNLSLAGAAVIADQFIPASQLAAGDLVFSPATNQQDLGYATISFKVVDTGGTLLGGSDTDPTDRTYRIDVSHVNDAPLISGPLQRFGTEDTPLIFDNSLKTSFLGVGDPDGNVQAQVTLDVAQGELSLSSSQGLVFDLGDGQADRQMRFTGLIQDINKALDGLSFHPDGNFAGATVLTLSIDDLGNTGSGGPKSAQAMITLNIQAVNDAPVLLASQSLSLDAGSNTVLTSTILEAKDIESSPGQLIYTLTHGLSQGELMLNGSLLDAGGTFSQADVNAGALMYRALPGGNGSEQLELSVSDAEGATIVATMNVTVRAKALPASTPAANAPPAPTTAPVVTEVKPVQAVRDKTESVKDDATASNNANAVAGLANLAAPAGASGETASEERRAAHQAGTSAVNDSRQANRVDNVKAITSNEIARVADTLSTPLQLNEFTTTTPLPAAKDTSPADAPRMEAEQARFSLPGITLPEQTLPLNKMAVDTQFQKAMEQAREDVLGVTALDRTAVATGIGVSASFTLGYILWLVRGGILISSLLASLPAWRMVDPLPVLGKLGGKARLEEDESLEEIIDHAHQDEPASTPSDENDLSAEAQSKLQAKLHAKALA